MHAGIIIDRENSTALVYHFNPAHRDSSSITAAASHDEQKCEAVAKIEKRKH